MVTRRNRRTGTMVTAEPSESVPGGWVTICEAHGSVCEHSSRSAAVEWMSDPFTWCEGCGDLLRDGGE